MPVRQALFIYLSEYIFLFYCFIENLRNFEKMFNQVDCMSLQILKYKI